MNEKRLAPGETGATGEWAGRPWILAGLLGLAGLLIFLVTDGRDDEPLAMATAGFLFFGPICAAFSLERTRWKEVVAFALIAGLVMAGLAWRAVNVGDRYADEKFGFAAGVLATVLAVPLFQAGFHKTRFATPYKNTHFFVWTDAVSAGGALAFTGLSWLMLVVLAELFALLRIDLLKDLIEEGWFGWTISGVAFGAALGVLRNQLGILGTLQSVVLLVLSLLAVPLAAALVLFLLAMVVSGPEVLWEATRSATPILLVCALGAFVLANAVVRDDDESGSQSQVMRIAALVLALGILPLTVFASISMGTRIAQYGLSPARLWALVAIGVACAYGLAYLVDVIRGGFKGWRAKLRRANLNLAVATCVFALFLALPVLDFGALSAANQLSRLERGAVSAEDFDYTALRWDFGDAGRRALAKLAASDDAGIAELAAEAQKQTERPYRWAGADDTRDERVANIHFQFEDAELREEVTQLVRNELGRCASPCVVFDLGPTAEGKTHLGLVERGVLAHLVRDDAGKLQYDYQVAAGPPPRITAGTEGDKGRVPQVEVRRWEGRQVYIDGKPAGQPFE